jgi:hypothetical protein
MTPRRGQLAAPNTRSTRSEQPFRSARKLSARRRSIGSISLPLKAFQSGHIFSRLDARTPAWSEKLSCELATLVGLPCARYELAEAEGGTRGVLSRSFVDSSSTLILGNMLLAKFEPGYDGTRKFNQIKYTLGNVLSVLRRIKNIDPPAGVERLSGLEVFIGYLVFDVWIGNTDRHHENWGVIVSTFEEKGFSVQLTPTFDHASSLGRELSDKSRAEQLSTRDSRADVEAYARRAHSAFFDDETGRRTLPMRAVLARLMRSHQRPTKLWADRVCALSSDEVQRVFSRMRRDWMSPHAEEFAIRLLAANAQTIIGFLR